MISHALSTGLFEACNGHEPKSAPTTKGLSAAVWLDRIEPAALASGLQATTARVVANVRIYTSMLAEPQDAIDPTLAYAVDVLMGAYSGDFTLNGAVRNVDLLGQTGQGMFAQAGYLEQDHKMFRVMTIFVPMIINDVWGQSA